MDKLIHVFRDQGVRAVSARLLLLYAASVGLFYAVDAGNRSAADALKAGVKSGKALSRLLVFGVAAASNALGVLTFVFLCRRLETAPRLAMVGLPLLFLLEKHARVMRADRESRGLESLLAAGLALGTVGAVLALMRGSPFA